MRAQYKVLAEKYSVITEASSVARYKSTIRKVIKCTTFEQVVEIVKTSGISNPSAFGYFEFDQSVNQVSREKGINSEEATVSLFQLIVQVYFLTKFPPSSTSIKRAKNAWKKWWKYYGLIKKAAELMKKAEREAEIKLDI